MKHRPEGIVYRTFPPGDGNDFPVVSRDPILRPGTMKESTHDIFMYRIMKLTRLQRSDRNIPNCMIIVSVSTAVSAVAVH